MHPNNLPAPSFDNHPSDAVALPEGVTWRMGAGDLPLLVVENAWARAVVSVYGGQVLSYAPHIDAPDGVANELFFASSAAHYQVGAGMKAGAPVCWPWFGRDTQGLGRAAHGFVRKHMWQVQSVVHDELGTLLRLRIDAAQIPAAWGWDFAFELVLEVHIGAVLQLRLTTHNRDARVMPVSQALHSYFALEDVAAASIDGLQGLAFFDVASTLDAAQLVEDGTDNPQPLRGVWGRQAGALAIEGEVDRIYHGVAAAVTLSEPMRNTALQRRVRIVAEGSDGQPVSTIVWNPGAELIQSFTDLAAHEYMRFVCIESGHTGQEALQLAPDASFTLSVTYALSFA